MKAGIFAAGFGERLGGPARGPKALTSIAGRPLIDWILDDLERARASEIAIIVNEQSLAVRDHVGARPRGAAIRWIVETTPSSMHSFFRIMEALASDGSEGPFLITTVDTIAPPGTYASFMHRAASFADADVVLALTTLIDDEKPFRIRLADDGSGSVVAMNDGPFATAGYYAVRSPVMREAETARAAGLAALRAFFAHAFARGARFAGVPMPDSIDVDRAEDVVAADALIRRAT